MYPLEQTETERLIDLMNNSSVKKEDIIKDYIDSHDTSDMMEGVKYYFKENDITSRRIYKYTNEGEKVIDDEAINNKMASGWHKLMVDQKQGYLVGEPVTVGYKDETDITPLLDLLGDEFDDVMPELVKSASNKGVEWLHPYIDKNGEFDYMIIPAQEFIPIYDNTKRKELIGGIRYYELDDETMKIELWDDQHVTYYEQINGQIYLDASVKENPQGHFYYGNSERSDGYGWGKVPFVEFANNHEKVSDLTFYKDYIDMYDRISSDSSNTLEEIQRFLYVLKGYEGTNIEEAITNFKRYKGVSVDGENGGVDIVQGDIPMDSVNSFLDRTREDLFNFGMGIDMSRDSFAGNPTGVALKFLYSFLDMKASVMERKFIKGLKQFFWFVTEYAKMAGVGEFDQSKLTFTFNKTMITNELENAQIAQASVGVISKRTIRENHNWVSDAEEEERRMKEEEESAVNLDGFGEGIEEDE